MKINDGKELGLMYISEAYTEGEAKNIDVHKDKSIDLFYVTFDTNLQDFDVMNRNRRYYDADNIMDCIKSERIQSLLQTGGWYGEYSHPTSYYADKKLSPERIQDVPPAERAFKIMNPKLYGNVLQARIQSAQGEVGEGFGKEVLAGWQAQFSARAIASMVMKNSKPYVFVKKLITYDAPWFPSHSIAHQTSDAKVTVKTFTESVETALEKASDMINGVMIPLKDILRDIGKTDVTTQMILESFDLTENNLYGFDYAKEHVIIKDENNMIYADIDPSTVKRINEFYNSFN